jgi:hypothetical protein
VRLAFFVITMLMVGPGLAPAQVDLAKALVGRWEGEIALRFQKTANPGLVLVITSVKEEGGRWTADARSGTKTSGLGPAKVEIDNSGKRPSLRWTGGTGVVYDVNLFDEKTLVGTATLTRDMSTERERPVKLEKKE